SHVQGDPESDHPFEQNLFGLNLEDVAVDPVEALVVVGDRLGGLARFLFRRASGEERVVDLGNHRGHGPSFLIGAGCWRKTTARSWAGPATKRGCPASRTMAASAVAPPSFETRPSAAPQDEAERGQLSR